MTPRTYTERAVYVPGVDILVCADLHLGRGDGPDYHLPIGDPAVIVRNLGQLLDRFDPGEVLIAGDVVDRFGPPDPSVQAVLQRLHDRCSDAGASLQIIAGNHDRGLAAAAEPAPPTEVSRGSDSPVVVCHGDQFPTAEGALVIYGHDHPMLTVEGARYPCILEGELPDGTELCQLPSFSPAVSGVRIGADRAGLRSPLSQAATTLRPIITDGRSGRIHRFPPLAALADHI